MKDKLAKKNHDLKLAIERYNLYAELINKYKETGSLDDYVSHLKSTLNNLSESSSQYYDRIIYSYKCGNCEPLLSNLYDKLLAADESKRKVSEDLKLLLKEV